MDKRFPIPTDETVIRASITAPKRLEALRGTGLLDTPPEESFDRITRLAAQLIGAPATFISLVDQHRDFYKSAYGLGEPLASERQIEGRTFCHYAILSTDALVLEDVTQLPQFCDVPTVQSLGVRAYVGIPLMTDDGSVIGSFCAIDYQPRHWSQTEIDILRELAHSAMREIEFRVVSQNVQSAHAHLLEQLSIATQAHAALRAAHVMISAIVDTTPCSVISTDTDGVIRTFNKAAERLLWYRADEVIGRTADQFHDRDEISAYARQLSRELGHTMPAGMQTLVAKAKAGLQDDNKWTYIRKDGARLPVRLVLTALRGEDPDADIIGFLGVAYDMSDQQAAGEYMRHSAVHADE